MTVFSFYIFNRFGDNIFYKQWKRTRSVPEGEARLVAGFVYTVQHISSQLSSTNNGGLRSISTPLYKLHYFETMTGYRAALMTDTNVSTTFAREVLTEIFKTAFSKTVTRNPNYRHEQGVLIEGTEFEEALDSLLRAKELI